MRRIEMLPLAPAAAVALVVPAPGGDTARPRLEERAHPRAGEPLVHPEVRELHQIPRRSAGDKDRPAILELADSVTSGGKAVDPDGR
jgi:hypothetical protein